MTADVRMLIDKDRLVKTSDPWFVQQNYLELPNLEIMKNVR